MDYFWEGFLWPVSPTHSVWFPVSLKESVPSLTWARCHFPVLLPESSQSPSSGILTFCPLYVRQAMACLFLVPEMCAVLLQGTCSSGWLRERGGHQGRTFIHSISSNLCTHQHVTDWKLRLRETKSFPGYPRTSEWRSKTWSCIRGLLNSCSFCHLTTRGGKTVEGKYDLYQNDGWLEYMGSN